MTTDELNALAALIQTHTAASRLTITEIRSMLEFVETRGYTVVAPVAETAQA